MSHLTMFDDAEVSVTSHWQDLPRTFEVSAEARTSRLERRVEYVLRQLRRRIDEVESLSAEVESLREQIRASRPSNETNGQVEIGRIELESLRRVEHEYRALLATKTMRLMKWPRELYARARRDHRAP